MILTEKAKQKVSELIGESRISIPDREIFLRISVQPGGCSGLRYQHSCDDRNQEGDLVREIGSVKVIVDKMSVPYLMGATIDFEDTISKQGFTIDNPNAAGSCACGDSFH
jgi:iron-sulfur cluster assembly accessory protein